ncbi:YebC-like protein [Marasmius fiardii PR-910]|nr:YebC-like protein [Marasmius fiardii PR-910]
MRSLVIQRCFSLSRPTFAGHNKWSKIKDKKGANDASRSATYNKATLDIINAARIGGSAVPEKNPSLAVVLKRVKAQNVPKENIAKALAKANKAKGSGETTVYEAIACNSVGIMIECSTDNTNRTVQTLREILTSRGARIAPVGFMFQRGGRVKVLLEKNQQFDEALEKLVEIAVDNGSEDFETSTVDDNQEEVGFSIQFTCEPTALSGLTTALTESKLCQVLASELAYKPVTNAELSDEEIERVNELVEALEANDDTMRVWTNLPMSE